MNADLPDANGGHQAGTEKVNTYGRGDFSRLSSRTRLFYVSTISLGIHDNIFTP